MWRPLGATVAVAAAAIAAQAAYSTSFGPHAWAVAQLACWVALLALRGWRGLSASDWKYAAWGLSSGTAFLRFLASDPGFQGWEDVYFFCGRAHEYCTAAFAWNARGWRKAFTLWNFVLSAALALQKLAVTVGLRGLLPGEEVVTRESFVSISWRLIPYWLNNWEQQWGAECSSMIFELPHFALELLVVLPLVQILCSRLRILAQPHLVLPPPPPRRHRGLGAALPAVGAAGEAAAAPALQQQQQQAEGGQQQEQGQEQRAGEARGAAAAQGRAGEVEEEEEEEEEEECLAPNVMRCCWERAPAQRALLPRLRANLRVMAVAAAVAGVALFNSLVMPVALERQVSTSERAGLILSLAPELAFVVRSGERAEQQMWRWRMQQWERQYNVSLSRGSGSGSSGSAGGSKSGAAAAEAAGAAPSPAAAAAAVLQEALERSSNSSRQEARLAVWSALWQPLLPDHWLQTMLRAEAEEAAGLDAGLLCALQYREREDSDRLAMELFSAANNASAVAAARGALRRLHTQQPAAESGPAAAHGAEGEGGHGAAAGGGGGGEQDAAQLLLMAALQAGIDSSAGPLRLRASRVPPAAAAGPPAEAAGEGPRRPAPAPAALAWLRQQQVVHEAAAAAARPRARSAAAAAAEAAPRWAEPPPHPRLSPLYRGLYKHAGEQSRMRDPAHDSIIALVELSLAIMRLSCERFFSLLAVYVGYLAFRDPPRPARRAVTFVAAAATAFQRLVLYLFPAICWTHGAGFVFSFFVSVVFWSGPLARLAAACRGAATSLRPRSWHAATAAEVERMGGQCAICWGGLEPAAAAAATAAAAPLAPEGDRRAPPPAAAGAAGGQGAAAAAEAARAGEAAGEAAAEAAAPASGGGGGERAMGLGCGHAYHRGCLSEWLRQCYAQGRGATCPMCQASIPLRVSLRLPWRRQRPHGAAAGRGGAEAGGRLLAGGAPGPGGLALLVQALQDDFQNRFEPVWAQQELHGAPLPAAAAAPPAAHAAAAAAAVAAAAPAVQAAAAVEAAAAAATAAAAAAAEPAPTAGAEPAPAAAARAAEGAAAPAAAPAAATPAAAAAPQGRHAALQGPDFEHLFIPPPTPAAPPPAPTPAERREAAAAAAERREAQQRGAAAPSAKQEQGQRGAQGGVEAAGPSSSAQGGALQPAAGIPREQPPPPPPSPLPPPPQQQQQRGGLLRRALWRLCPRAGGHH